MGQVQHTAHLEIINRQMNESGAQTGHGIKNQHFLRTPKLFQYTAKHEHAEHVEEDMGKIGVHENMRYDLVGFKKGRFHAEKRKMPPHEFGMEYIRCQPGGGKYDDIDNDNVLHHRGKSEATTGTKKTHK